MALELNNRFWLNFMYCIIVAKSRIDMILVTLTDFQGRLIFHPFKTVKSAFSELCLLNQWLDLHQTCIDTLFGDRKELIRWTDRVGNTIRFKWVNLYLLFSGDHRQVHYALALKLCIITKRTSLRRCQPLCTGRQMGELR